MKMKEVEARTGLDRKNIQVLRGGSLGSKLTLAIRN